MAGITQGLLAVLLSLATGLFSLYIFALNQSTAPTPAPPAPLTTHASFTCAQCGSHEDKHRKTCPTCRGPQYCSRACQRAHKRVHGPVCGGKGDEEVAEEGRDGGRGTGKGRV